MHGDDREKFAAVAALYLRDFAVLLLWIVAGCAMIDLPRCSVRTPTVEVHASTINDAARVAVYAEEVVPHLRSILGTNSRSIRIALLDTELPGPAAAHCTTRWIIVGCESRGHERIVIAHELTHWLAVDHWDVLAGPMEEGLAIFLSLQIEASNPGTWELSLITALHRYLQDPAATGDIESSLKLSPRAFTRATFPRHPDKNPLRGLGYLLVTRIGVQRLSELCRETQRKGLALIPSAELYRAAGLGTGDLDDLRLAAEQLLLHPIHAMRLEGAVPPGATTFEIQ